MPDGTSKVSFGTSGPGTVLGKYRLIDKLGVGGMGEVWRATHANTGRAYAVKFMHGHAAASATVGGAPIAPRASLALMAESSAAR